MHSRAQQLLYLCIMCPSEAHSFAAPLMRNHSAQPKARSQISSRAHQSSALPQLIAITRAPSDLAASERFRASTRYPCAVQFSLSRFNDHQQSSACSAAVRQNVSLFKSMLISSSNSRTLSIHKLNYHRRVISHLDQAATPTAPLAADARTPFYPSPRTSDPSTQQLHSNSLTSPALGFPLLSIV